MAARRRRHPRWASGDLEASNRLSGGAEYRILALKDTRAAHPARAHLAPADPRGAPTAARGGVVAQQGGSLADPRWSATRASAPSVFGVGPGSLTVHVRPVESGLATSSSAGHDARIVTAAW